MIGDVTMVSVAIQELERRAARSAREAELRAQVGQDGPMRPTLARRIARLLGGDRIAAA